MRRIFSDQLENIILPALKAGFIVLADRYIYTLMAPRIWLRGMDRKPGLKNLYGIAPGNPTPCFTSMCRRRNLFSASFAKKLRPWIIGESGHGPRPITGHVLTAS